MLTLVFMMLRSENTDDHDAVIADAEVANAEGADAGVDDNNADAHGACADVYEAEDTNADADTFVFADVGVDDADAYDA